MPQYTIRNVPEALDRAIAEQDKVDAEALPQVPTIGANA